MPARLTYLFAAIVLIGALIHPAIGHAASRGIDVTLKASEAPAAAVAGTASEIGMFLGDRATKTFAALARVKINKLKQQKQVADAAPPKPQAPLPVKPAVRVFPKKTGQVFRDCADCPEMVVVPAGSFRMGSNDGDSDEKPVHQVTIPRPFAVGKYEVTQAEWRALLGWDPSYFENPSRFKGDRNPVEKVSWNNAQDFVRRLGIKTGKQYRLLTEAEWEYAARAGTMTPFHFGATISTDQANYDGNYTYGGRRKGVYRKKTVPVGSFPANAFGLHDMHGNVWEWVEDCYRKNYNGAPSDGSAVTGSNSCERVRRGGSWISYPKNLRSAFRLRNYPDDQFNINGFRIARTLP